MSLVVLSDSRICAKGSIRIASWLMMVMASVTYRAVALWVAASMLVEGAPLDEDRPAMAFCDTDSKDLSQFMRAGVTGFQEMHPGSQENSITISDLNIKIAMFKIREVELRNTANIFISEDSTITCDDNEMKLNIMFGIKDAEIVFKDKPGTPGFLFVTMSLFEADVVITLPRRDSKIIIDSIKVRKMDDLKIEVKTGSGASTDMVNSFVKSLPKNVLMSMVSKYLTKSTQEFVDKNPIGI